MDCTLMMAVLMNPLKRKIEPAESIRRHNADHQRAGDTTIKAMA